ncbi:SDR family NAD(P)-dependent oxidoreductase, partial [Streptomyces coeruleorubidus]|uniref:type I polyketide synthase n=1 Tax=Streptomyces coeruleorubidus TaxID=116188 RepID=UPI0037A69DAA
RDHDEAHSLTRALAGLHTTGVRVDWQTFFTGTPARPTDLPTYPFRREPFWLTGRSPATEAASTGTLGQAMLTAKVEPADGEGVLFTGQAAPRTHPWLETCGVLDTLVLPPAAVVDLAVRVGDELGADVLSSLTCREPLVLARHTPTEIQLAVRPQDTEGRWEFTLYARPAGENASWTAYAEGTLTAGRSATPPPTAGTDGTPVRLPEEYAADTTRYGLHPLLLEEALATVPGGSASAGTVRVPVAWHDVRLHATGAEAVRVHHERVDEDTVALRLTDDAGQPVLTVGSVTFRELPEEEFAAGAAAALPLYRVEWETVALPDRGEPVRWAELGEGTDGYGDVSAVAEAVVSGVAIDAVRLWAGTSVDRDTVAELHRRTHETLALVQRYLADERLAEVPLVVITHGAVTTGVEELPDIAAAGTWGLLRSAQVEAPGRIVLLDLEHPPGTEQRERVEALLAAVLTAGEPQAAVRNGRLRVPRLQRSSAGTAQAQLSSVAWDPDGTVLITGGTGALGALVARHLAERHGVRRMLLLSRRGPAAPRAHRLVADLARLGVQAEAVACDVADRDALEKVLDAVPAAHPLTGVVHAAGVLDNGLLTDLTPQRVDAVLRPKADAAWHLHELTEGGDLSAFVLFSSSTAVLGGPGQGHYAAANAFLDALAGRRAADGLAATSIAWGLWDSADLHDTASHDSPTTAADDHDHDHDHGHGEDGTPDRAHGGNGTPDRTPGGNSRAHSGINACLSDAGRRRYAQEGFRAIRVSDGLRLLDAALTDGEAQLVALPFDTAAMRGNRQVPSVFHGLVPAPNRRGAAGPAAAHQASDTPAFVAKLAALPGTERQDALLGAVRAEVAAVLGHADSQGVAADRPFHSLGFDSMTAEDLRNRLVALTGLRLPSTLAFDHPNPEALAAHLLERMALSTDAGPLADLDRVEAALLAATDAQVRDAIAARLQDLLARTAGAGCAPGAPDTPDTAHEVAASLEDASAEDLIAFIDTQLG